MIEKELIQKSLRGDEKAFALLMSQNQHLVFRHCLRMVKDENIARDLTQETFIHAYQHMHNFKMKARFSTWLWKIAHNLSLNYLRKHSNHEKEYKEEILLSKQFDSRDEVFIQKIYSVVDQLPLKQRIVFELYDLQQIPQKEIAVRLGISHGTVRSRLFYARKKIRQFLQEISSRSLK